MRLQTGDVVPSIVVERVDRCEAIIDKPEPDLLFAEHFICVGSRIPEPNHLSCRAMRHGHLYVRSARYWIVLKPPGWFGVLGFEQQDLFF